MKRITSEREENRTQENRVVKNITTKDQNNHKDRWRKEEKSVR